VSPVTFLIFSRNLQIWAEIEEFEASSGKTPVISPESGNDNCVSLFRSNSRIEIRAGPQTLAWILAD
jgi:hypothetical protein